jgi:hypothetical protein
VGNSENHLSEDGMVSGLGIVGSTWNPDTVTQGVAIRKRDETSVTTPLELVTESGGIDPNATNWGLWIVVGIGLIWMLGRR